MRPVPLSSTPSLFDLTGRVAVVTGGVGLLGKEFCRTLIEAGATVVVADLNEAAALQFAQRLQTEFCHPVDENTATLQNRALFCRAAMAIKTDITDIHSVRQMVTQVVQTYGRLDILVNSAAMDPKMDPHNFERSTSELLFRSVQRVERIGAFEDFPLDAWNQALAVNLTGAFLCCQAAVQPMLQQGGGVIINLSSIYGVVAPDQRLYQTVRNSGVEYYKPVYYPVTKEGILGLTKYLAAYYAGQNIRVNALSPGGVYNGHNDEFVNAYSAKAVMGRMADKADMNGALLFLASDASAYMTGANLVVDGGWTVW